MGDDRERGVVGTLRQAQQRFPELACRVQLWPCNIKPPQPKQDRDKLWRLAHLLTQRTCLGVGVLHLGRCVPFGICRAAPRAMYRVKACWVRSGVSGRVLSSSIPVVKWLMASRLAERSLACWPARCQ